MKKKVNRNTNSNFWGRTYDVSSVKDVTRKFHVVVVQQQRQRNVQKSVLHVQSCFLLIKPTVVVVVLSLLLLVFLCRSQCRRRLALHVFIFA